MEIITTVPDKIVAARVSLLFRQPFFGNMATRFKVQEASKWCSTAATDGRNLFYNTKFFDTMSISQVEFVICHEIYHIIFDHIGRLEGRNKKIWNIATDYAVNNILLRDKIGTAPDIKFYHDKKYEGKSAEEIYDDILEKSQEALDKLGKMLDEHIEWGDGNGEEDCPTYSKEELSEIRDEVLESIIQSYQASAGNVPAEIARMVKSLTESKMNWRELLRNNIQSMLKNDYTWSKPSRKTMSYGFYLPSMNYDNTIDVVIALDNSGSCYNEVMDFLSEVKGIMEEYRDFTIKLFTFDTRVYNEVDYSSDNSEELLEYEVKGGGGTEFQCVWDYMKDQDIVPKKLIFFTDGYNNSTNWSNDPDYCETLFVIHSNDGCESPFGTTIHYS